MKKLFSVTFAFLVGTIAVMAQNNSESHWTFNADKWPGETIIYCSLNQETATDDFNPFNYNVAAFIEGEIRALGEYKRDNAGIYFLFVVKGDVKDMGKSITFKAYNTTTKAEYDIILKDTPKPTYNGETQEQGIPSNLYKLYLPMEVTEIKLPETITVAKGGTIDMAKQITVTPTGATLPNNLVWDFANSYQYIKVENNILTGLDITERAYLGLSVGSYSTYTYVIVNNPATAITIKSDHQSITVNKDDDKALTDFLNNAFTLTPADASDKVTWAIADTKIVQDLAPTAYGYRPIAAGTTTLTAQILNPDGSVRIAANQKVTVNVVVPLESIRFNFNHNLFECNVGDDLTNYLNSILTFTPSDATNKNVKWSINTGDAIAIQNNKITAVKSGTASIRVTSEENKEAIADIRITVHNPAKDVTFSNNTIGVTYSGKAIDISQQIINNIQFGPTGFEAPKNLQITATANQPVSPITINSVAFSNGKLSLTAQAVGVGSATITVSFTYPNYLQRYQNPNSNSDVSVSKSFTVNVAEGLNGFEIAADNLAFGQAGVITLTPTPAGSDFDASKVAITVKSTQQLPASWTQTVNQGTQTNTGMTFSITPNVPGNVVITVVYNGQTFSTENASVGMPFALDEGWQWRTINYGYAEPGTLEQVFGGNNLVEIRSQNELLYNDPKFGYFGDLANHGVMQNTCYKIKTKAASKVPFIMTVGSLYTNSQEIAINEGWTWIPNPYLYARPIATILNNIGHEGDRIVSKSGGFAEHNGRTWTGDLTTLVAGEGYLYHTNGATTSISFPQEFELGPVTTTNGSRQVEQSVWQYDAGEFRDNMTIVARAENIADMNDYSIGAFVGNECRGEGRLVEGRLFITVHGKGGETISFRFYDPTTRETFAADELITFQPMAGTLKAPVRLTRGSSTTGIDNVQNAKSIIQSYNMNGMRTNGLQHGVNIIRDSDGSVRKVLGSLRNN